jgi:hypothetical protein
MRLYAGHTSKLFTIEKSIEFKQSAGNRSPAYLQAKVVSDLSSGQVGPKIFPDGT